MKLVEPARLYSTRLTQTRVTPGEPQPGHSSIQWKAGLGRVQDQDRGDRPEMSLVSQHPRGPGCSQKENRSSCFELSSLMVATEMSPCLKTLN